MERKYIIIKSSCDSKDGKNETFFSDMIQQVSDTSQIQKISCDRNNSLLSTSSSTSFFIPPSPTWTGECDVSGNNVHVYSHTDDSLTCLATCIHSALDSLPPPGTCLVSVLWLCGDTPPPHPAPQLYGALQRARAWHGAGITVITRDNVSSVPTWLTSLQAELIPASYLCDCHGLQEFLSPSLSWRGSLAFYDTNLGFVSLPGFELHLDHDQLDDVLNNLGQDLTNQPRNVTKYMSSQLEVVTTVPSVTSILAQPQYLTNQRLELKTPIFDDEGMSGQFFTSGFDDKDTGYILKLKYSFDKPKYDPNLLKTENWKQSVINCNFSEEPPCPSLGSDVHSINILVFDGSQEDSDCSRATHKKTAVILKNFHDISNLFTLKQSLAQPEVTEEDVKNIVSGMKKFSFDEKHLLQLKAYIRDVQAKVLEILKENKSDLLTHHSIDDILIAVQEEIFKNVEGVIFVNNNVESHEINEIKESLENEDVNVDDDTESWPEVRFLKYLSLHAEKEEQEKVAQSKLLKHCEEDYVVLEAKELIKHFDKNGLASKPLDPVEVKNKNCPLRPQKTDEDFNLMMTQYFDPIPPTGHSFKGFRFKEEKDFSTVEFTQYHDVYYNTGLQAENYDTDCKNYRDCMVGPHRETKSTFSSSDAASTRLKVISRRPSENMEKKEVKQERRSSPRKKVAPLQNISNKKPVMSSSSRRPSLDKSDSKLDVSKNSEKGENRRKSGGEAGANPGDLSDINKRKLRLAVYDTLIKNKIDEKNPLFKRCFPKLFNICKMYVIEGSDDNSGSVKKWMTEIAECNAPAVINLEKMMMKRKK